MIFLDHFLNAFFWYACIQIFAFAVTPTLAYLLPHFPDRGLGLSKPLGLLAIGFSTWLFSVCTGAEANGTLILTILGFWIGLGIWCHTKNKRNSRGPSSLKVGRYLATEAVFALAYIGFIALKAYQPEIFWGEKPMDFTFLNFLTRNTQLPPQDPWAAGMGMKYYYLGTFLFACIHKITGISTTLGYNLALATVPAFTFATLYSLLGCLGLGFRASLAGCAFYQFISSWEGVRLLFSGSSVNFDQFWATTRILKPAMGTEYPLWSFLFGDLHAHFMAIPYALAILTLICSLLVRRVSPKTALTVSALTGILFGALIAINTWDVLTTGLVAVTGAIFLLHDRSAERLRFLVSFLCCSILAYVFSLPFLKGEVGQGAGKGLELYAFTTFAELFRCLGMFLLPIFSLGLFFLISAKDRPMKTAVISTKSLLATAVLLGMSPTFLLCYQEGFRILALPGLLTGLTLIAFGTLLFCRLADHAIKTAGFLTAAAGVLMAFFEVLWLNDRMNTLFKVYYMIWSCLSLSAFLLLVRALRILASERARLGTLKELARQRKLLFSMASVALLALAPAVFTSITNVWVMSTFQRIPGPRPTIDGLAYLETSDPEEYQLASFIQKNVKGTPTVLEAQGQSYDQFTRVASRTGLPTVLGWDHHVMQRGVPQNEIETRKGDIKTMYSSTDWPIVMRLLKKYHVRYIVIGAKEKSTYPAEGLAKFSNQPDFFLPVFKATNTFLLEVL